MSPSAQVLDAFQWTGDRLAFEKWYGSTCPIDRGEQLSVPTGRTSWLRVWVGNWIIRHEGECHCVTDAVYRNFIATNPAGGTTTVTQPGESGRYTSGTSGGSEASGTDARSLVATRNALVGMVGLVQLVCERNDLPVGLRTAIEDNHRYRVALAVLNERETASNDPRPHADLLARVQREAYAMEAMPGEDDQRAAAVLRDVEALLAGRPAPAPLVASAPVVPRPNAGMYAALVARLRHHVTLTSGDKTRAIAEACDAIDSLLVALDSQIEITNTERAAREALERAPKMLIPEGWKLVPVTLYGCMEIPAVNAAVNATPNPWPEAFWKTALDHAPQPPESSPPKENIV